MCKIGNAIDGPGGLQVAARSADTEFGLRLHTLQAPEGHVRCILPEARARLGHQVVTTEIAKHWTSMACLLRCPLIFVFIQSGAFNCNAWHIRFGDDCICGSTGVLLVILLIPMRFI